MRQVSTGFEYLLVLTGVFMCTWGAFGLIEYAGGSTVIPLQNPTFPAGMQFLHFAGILTSGVLFLTGYACRWSRTPMAMVVIYAVLATLCAVQTLDMLLNANRYVFFACEIVGYVVICLYLFKSDRMRRRFGLM